MDCRDTCEEFKVFSSYDSWVVPHQVLPAMAVVIGLNWKDVLLIMYAWETLEVIFLNCIQIAEAEISSNALVSDPTQCVIGIFVGTMLLRTFNNGSTLIPDTLGAVAWSTLFILPGVPIIFGGDYVWGYIPAFAVCMAAIRHYVPNKELALALAVYVVAVSVSIFATEDSFNSFYIGIIVGLVFLGGTVTWGVVYNKNGL